MARTKANDQKRKNNGANVGYEAELWQMADALRGSMDAAEHKHVVLGLIFLNYISDALPYTGINAQIAHGDTFHNDRHLDLKADFILANPHFNDSD